MGKLAARVRAGEIKPERVEFVCPACHELIKKDQKPVLVERLSNETKLIYAHEEHASAAEAGREFAK